MSENAKTAILAGGWLAAGIAAMKASTPGRLVRIPLPPGTYTISGRFKDASFNGVHPGRTERVTITPGYKVRQDFFLDVP